MSFERVGARFQLRPDDRVRIGAVPYALRAKYTDAVKVEALEGEVRQTRRQPAGTLTFRDEGGRVGGGGGVGAGGDLQAVGVGLFDHPAVVTDDG